MPVGELAPVMARGYDSDRERKHSLSLLGKDLARRAKSRCELTRASGVPLATYEIPPIPKDPDFNRCLLVSEQALRQLEDPRNLVAAEWHHLKEIIWSDIPAVQIMALRILRHLATTNSWAQNLIDETYLDPEVTELADEAELGSGR